MLTTPVRIPVNRKLLSILDSLEIDYTIHANKP